MYAAGFLICCVFTGSGDLSTGTGPRCTPDQFQSWFESASEGELHVPEAVVRAARSLRFVFVGGFGSERMSGYFLQNARDLRAFGVPSESIDFIFPSSDGTLDQNAGLVAESLKTIATQGPGPRRTVVIAHSRGACDVLAFALRNPDFVAEHIVAMFLVQGPFGGTGLADGVTGAGPGPDRGLGPVNRGVLSLLALAERSLLRRGSHGGLTDLTREASEEFWARLLAEHYDAIETVGPRTFYVTSATAPGRHRIVLRSTASYLQKHQGRNDGVVALEDQSLPGVGTVFAVLDAGHTDLTHRSGPGRSGRMERLALVESILMAVAGVGP